MEYDWSNSTWKSMEAMRKQEDYQSKLSRDMYNFYHSGGNRSNTYCGNNHGSGNFTLKRHIGGCNFSRHARSYEHNSYDCYEGSRLGARNYYNNRSYERVPRNEVINEGNYVNIDGRLHKREGMLKDTMIVMNIMSIAMVVRTLRSKKEGQLHIPSLEIVKLKSMEPSMVDELPRAKEHSQAKVNIEESVETNVEEEISDEDICHIINEKNIEKKRRVLRQKKKKEWEKKTD
ncbi:hypothetical protein M9H77_18626 [Catharanthus roseus]|uniref:Uncharacterized protein n=1 Tax=Catharanthus roseus TaxID=4058 RepID=A0ACC0B889_CATRO|nr:hypothetical protein M9H77_18626 [Catharanthus roseus]